MKIDFDPTDLRPLIRDVVAEVLDQARADEAKLNGRLAYPEAEAAALIGVPRHVLRDCRLRGEVTGTTVGKKVVYDHSELLRFLRRKHE